jgi:heat shock protein HspQ
MDCMERGINMKEDPQHKRLKFKKGDLVRHKASGFKGIILGLPNIWRDDDEYEVKFAATQQTTNTRLTGKDDPITIGHFVETCKEFELVGDTIKQSRHR